MINTVIINPNRQVREKITSLLTAEDGIKVLAEGNDGYDALRLIGNLKPDIAIIDNQLEFIEGGDIPPLLKVRSPLTLVVLLAARINDEQLCNAATNEVSGFVYSEADIDILPSILKCIIDGGCFISPWFASRILHILSSASREAPAKAAEYGNLRIGSREDPIGCLSKMELRVLSLVGEGKTSEETAMDLGLKVGTVRNYVSSVMRKTGARNRSEMVRHAFFYGLVPLNPR